MQRITSLEQVDDVFGQDCAILFKHSTRCPLSAGAFEEVERFFDSNPEVSVYLIHAIEDRPISQYVEQKTGVPHCSPQVIFLEDGRATWQTSHAEITSDVLEEQLGKV